MYGYFCHHIAHVADIRDTSDVKREWIHIRYSKEYLVSQYDPNTTEAQTKIFQQLYDNHPSGIYFTPKPDASTNFPIYKNQFGNTDSINPYLFDGPEYQFMSRNTQILWIEDNKTTNEALNQVLTSSNRDYIEKEINISQEQQRINAMDFDTVQDLSFDHEDNDADSNEESNNEEYTSYANQLGLLKRARDLCGNDAKKHKEIYDLLGDFVTRNETDHNDNDNVIKKREKGGTIMISSNKVLKSNSGSCKRFKASYEK